MDNDYFLLPCDVLVLKLGVRIAITRSKANAGATVSLLNIMSKHEASNRCLNQMKACLVTCISRQSSPATMLGFYPAFSIKYHLLDKLSTLGQKCRLMGGTVMAQNQYLGDVMGVRGFKCKSGAQVVGVVIRMLKHEL